VTAPRLHPVAAAVLTWLAAACILVLEIAAGRLLAPYVGVSLTTYTGIIGVVLGGIALGAWAGGQLADRGQPERLIGPTFVLGGLAAMAAVPVVGVVGELGLGTDPVAIVVLATVGFVAPAAILAAVAPMIVRASLVDVASSGSLVGRLSAIGTLGAIAGTFLTGFVLLGVVPTRLLVAGTGALLVLIGAGVLLAGPRGRRSAALAAIAALGLARVAAAPPDPCQRESAYFCMTVLPDAAHPAGRTLVLDRVHHAYVDLEDPSHLQFRYERWFADASADVLAEGGSLDVLHIGGGGFTFPRYLQAADPDSRHTVLELDPEVLDIARTELGLDPSTLDIRLGDARTTIARLPDGAFDLAVGDAFSGLSVPWHLTTTELLSQVDRTLRPRGRYVMNLIDGPGLRFARAETATLRVVWEHVAVVAPSSALQGSGGSNVVLVASHHPIDADALRGRVHARGDSTIEVLSGGPSLDAFARGAPVLRDDFAPVDQLLVR
jgi:predicted membrane-bound spermidine synthase